MSDESQFEPLLQQEASPTSLSAPSHAPASGARLVTRLAVITDTSLPRWWLLGSRTLSRRSQTAISGISKATTEHLNRQ
jgi:hypothetical protein